MIHSFFTRKSPDSQPHNATVSPALYERASITKRAKIQHNSLIFRHLPPPQISCQTKARRIRIPRIPEFSKSGGIPSHTSKFQPLHKESLGQRAQRNAENSQARRGGAYLLLPFRLVEIVSDSETQHLALKTQHFYQTAPKESFGQRARRGAKDSAFDTLPKASLRGNT